jgi:hypothetical protein
MEQWSDEVELYPETQRFGNRAFRKYISLVEEVRLSLHKRKPELMRYTATPLGAPHSTGNHCRAPPAPPPIPRVRTPRSTRLRVGPRIELCARAVRDGTEGVLWTRGGRRERRG